MSDWIFLLTILIVLSFLLRLITHLQTWRYFAQIASTTTAQNWQPNVSIIVPVKGLDQGALANFRSLCNQAYVQPYELIFALESESEPAVPVIQALIQENSDQSIRLVLSNPLGLTAVGKLKNLIAGYRASRHEVIVLIDSDVHVESDILTRSVNVVEPSGAGAAYAVPVCEGSEDWVAALHNLLINNSVPSYASTAYQK